jgi:hypothetical protein
MELIDSGSSSIYHLSMISAPSVHVLGRLYTSLRSKHSFVQDLIEVGYKYRMKLYSRSSFPGYLPQVVTDLLRVSLLALSLIKFSKLWIGGRLLLFWPYPRALAPPLDTATSEHLSDMRDALPNELTSSPITSAAGSIISMR